MSRSCLLVLVAAAVVACPEPGPGGVDSAPPADGGLALNEAGLALCATPGTYCTPADSCGLSPRCNAAGVCITAGTRDCDDGISCTTDRCVPGGCEHLVASGYCLIDEMCHKKGATVGCGRCLPEVFTTRWSPLDGVSCDDKNPCTKGDECKQGSCVGQPYSCSDGLSCTTDSCDGLGGCKSFLLPKYCLIEKLCHSDGEVDPTGCKVCDVSVASDQWQPRPKVCTIEGMCHVAGATDATGCYTCEPLHAPTTWTPLPDTCLVSQVCLKQGTSHPSGCATCDPTVHTDQWTPVTGGSLSTEGFDSGGGGYILSKPMGAVGWQVHGGRYTSPPSSLYYGNPVAGNYDTSGQANSGSATTPAFQLPAQQKAFLTFQLYMDTETSATFDVLQVEVEGQVLWSKATLKVSDYRVWKQITVDLGGFAGKSIQVVFQFDTKDDLNNQSEGVYIDDVMLLTGCGSI